MIRMSLGDRSLPHLPRPAQENHLPEIFQALRNNLIVNSRLHGVIISNSSAQHNYQSGTSSGLANTPISQAAPYRRILQSAAATTTPSLPPKISALTRPLDFSHMILICHTTFPHPKGKLYKLIIHFNVIIRSFKNILILDLIAGPKN